MSDGGRGGGGRGRERAGVDQRYLRESQYKDPSNLNARIALHAKYSRSEEPWFPWLAAQVPWREGAEVLEVGCGSGLLWTTIGPLLPQVRLTLTDLSEGMVAAASAAVAAAGAGNVEVVEGRVCDAQALPFGDGVFDVVVANHMLYHVPDPGRAVAEFARVLRPDGTLLAATNGPSHLAELRAMSREALGWSGLDSVDRQFGRTNGGEVLGRSFEVVEWHDHPTTMVVTDPADVVAFILSSGAADTATAEVQARVPAVVGEAFARAGGSVAMTTEAGCFVARDARDARGARGALGALG